MDLAKEAGKLEAETTYKTSWGVGLGVGVHNGDWYVPVILEKNLSPKQELQLEAHVNTKGELTGGQVATIWKF